ncbi:MAG: hypothetical protein V1853_04925 [bacterium]
MFIRFCCVALFILCSSLSSVYGQKVDLSRQYKLELEEIQTQLAEFEHDPYLGALVSDVLVRLPDYQEVVLDGLEIAQRCSIHVVLQMHDYIGSSQYEQQQALDSQSKLRDFLEANQFDVIGFEGNQLEHVTFQALLDDALIQAEKQGIIVTRSQLEQGIAASLPFDGVLMFLNEHPDADIVGIEDLALNRLHDTILGLLQQGYGIGASLEEVNFRLSDLRSDLAVAKLARRLSTSQGTSGALPIGYLHETRLRKVFQRYGISGDFIDLR